MNDDKTNPSQTEMEGLKQCSDVNNCLKGSVSIVCADSCQWWIYEHACACLLAPVKAQIANPNGQSVFLHKNSQPFVYMLLFDVVSKGSCFSMLE